MKLVKEKSGMKVFITGATSGIGLAHAIYLSSRGNEVIGGSIAGNTDKKALREAFLRDHVKYRFDDAAMRSVVKAKSLLPRDIVETLDESIDRVRFMQMDVCDDDSVRGCVDAVEAEGPIDVLVNNAIAFSNWGAIEEVGIDEIKALFEVGLFGHLRVIRAVVPHMRARKAGLIVNTTSMAAVLGVPFIGHYSALKAGMERITEALYNELKPFGVKVASLLPGDINTAILSNQLSRSNGRKATLPSDIGTMLDSFPGVVNSPYTDRSRTVWEAFIRNHIVAPTPLSVSLVLERIIRAKKPKVHYMSGNFLQTKLAATLKTIISDRALLDITAKIFGL